MSSRSTFLGHPTGVILLAIVEFWERFAYWGMLSLMALFLTAPVTSGGFGWDMASTVGLFGLYTGIIFIVPVIGSWFANNVFGERASIRIGFIFLGLAYLGISVAASAPTLITHCTNIDIVALLDRSNVKLGEYFVSDVDKSAISQAALSPAETSVALRTLTLISLSFYGGLIFSFIGAALIKAPIASLIGKLYDHQDYRRDSGYSIYYAFMVVGGSASAIVIGGIGEKFGWYLGFLSCTIGMVLALIIYTISAHRYLGDTGSIPQSCSKDETRRRIGPLEKSRLVLIVISIIFVSVYEGAFYQKVGLINLYIRDHVNRHVFGFEVPASWFNSITFISCAFLTPVVIMILNMIEKRFRSITPYEKLYLALGLMSICFFSLSYVFTGYDGTGDEKVSPWVIIGVFTTFGLCEILVWPPQMAAVSKLSPATYVTIAIGALYTAAGFGNFIAGGVGLLISYLSASSVFLIIAIGLSASALSVMALHRRFMGMSGGAL